MELAEVVAAAVRSRRPELELLVREQVDAELARVIGELVEQELAARRNGGPVGDASPPSPEVEGPPPGTRRCTSCGETKPLAGFPLDAKAREGRRNVCAECRARRRREVKAAKRAAAEEPHPRRGAHRGRRGQLIAAVEYADGESRRELLAELRQNGVTTELVDGLEFR